MDGPSFLLHWDPLEFGDRLQRGLLKRERKRGTPMSEWRAVYSQMLQMVQR